MVRGRIESQANGNVFSKCFTTNAFVPKPWLDPVACLVNNYNGCQQRDGLAVACSIAYTGTYWG